MTRRSTILFVILSIALCWPSTVNASDAADGNTSKEMKIDKRITYNSFARMWRRTYRWAGKQRKGVSRKKLNEEFDATLHSKVMDHMKKALGGSIDVFGERSDADYGTCGKRPRLTMADVTDLALQSFNLTDFHPSIPPCNNGGKIVACNYDTGSCCQRPQVEFIGRYYDTAVAAMALGATKDEAFAPLVHARALAFTLEACDPDINYHGNFNLNDLKFQGKRGRRAETYLWQGWGLSLIALPPSYEVLYELYNTMLIERLRSRKTTVFPTHAQMKILQDRVYYKKLIARVIYMDYALDEGLSFPSTDDFQAAGLTMITSSRMQSPFSASADAAEVMKSADHDVEYAVRKSDKDVTVYERSSSSMQVLDFAKCNRQLKRPDFFQFKVSDSVSDKYEACCAQECHFMSTYGGSFSAGSANCCAGCNRASCSANDANIALMFAKIGTIESPSKANAGPMEMTMSV